MRTRIFSMTVGLLILSNSLLFAQKPRGVRQSAGKPSTPAKVKTVAPVPIDPDAIKKPVVYPSMDLAERIKFWIGRRIVLPAYKSQVRTHDAAEDFKDVAQIEEWKMRALYREKAALEADYAGRSGKTVAARNLSVSDYPQRLMSENWVELLIEVENSPKKLVTWVTRNDDPVFGFADEMELAKTFVGKHIWNRFNLFSEADGGDNSFNKPGNRLTVTAVEWRKESIDPTIKVRVKRDDGAQAYLDGPAGSCFDTRFHYNCKTYFTDEKHFDFEDPRKKFPGWTPQMWRLIESEKVAVGMTLDMLKLACARDLEAREMVFDTRSKQAATIYMGCSMPYKYLVVNGRVKAIK